MNTTELQNRINYKFKNEELLNIALTRRSYAVENNKFQYNQRLEFLGDSVLGLTIAEELYKKFPYLKEGNLTRLKASVVCEKSLAIVANELEIQKYLNIGKGELQLKIQNLDSTTSDTLEAIYGAVYLDSDFDTAKKLILSLMTKQIKVALSNINSEDPKSCLQELVQKSSKTDLIYTVTKEEGPEHNKYFEANVSHMGKILGEGYGKTKKAAEKMAAANAIKNHSHEYD